MPSHTRGLLDATSLGTPEQYSESAQGMISRTSLQLPPVAVSEIDNSRDVPMDLPRENTSRVASSVDSPPSGPSSDREDDPSHNVIPFPTPDDYEPTSADVTDDLPNECLTRTTNPQPDSSVAERSASTDYEEFPQTVQSHSLARRRCNILLSSK